MKVRVLLAEDDCTDEEYITRSARKVDTGIDIVTAGTFEDAIAKLADPSGWDLVLAEHRIQGNGDGIDIVRASRYHTVVMTDIHPDHVAERAQRVGALATVPRQSIIDNPAELKRLINLAQTRPTGITQTMLETEQGKLIQSLRSELDTLKESKRNGIERVIDGIGRFVRENKLFAWALLGLIVLGIIAVLATGTWPG